MPDVSPKPGHLEIGIRALPDDLPELKIVAPTDYTVVPTTIQTLFCGDGQLGDRRILAPYLSLRLLRAKDLEESSAEDPVMVEAFTGTLAFENVAYLILDLARDYRNECRRLKTFAAGPLKPEPMRLDYAAGCLERAQRAIQDAIKDLDAVAADSAPPPSVTRVPLRKVRPRPKPKPTA